MNKPLGSVLIAACCLGAIGCREDMPVTFDNNLVHAHKYEMTKDLPMDQVVRDTDWALERLFGSPDEPRLPVLEADSELANLVTMEHLEMASGPPNLETGAGLFRQHCTRCHGITGDGRGPAGVVITPYPRDYRMGVFKFKSTTRGAKPTRMDVDHVIRNGIGGTAMSGIQTLAGEDVPITEDQIDALVDYVIYLSWRGEVERSVIDAAMFDLDLAAGERVIRPENADLLDREITEFDEQQEDQLDELLDRIDAAFEESVAQQVQAENPEADEDTLEDLVDDRLDAMKVSEEAQRRDQIARKLATDPSDLALWEQYQQLERKEQFEENWGYIMDSVADVGESWLEAEDEVTEVEPHGDIPDPANQAEFAAMMNGPEAEALKASVARGHELFLSEAVGCAKCHGKQGKGDGQTTDFDDWTKDWTTNVGLDPNKSEQLLPLLARGALPPVTIKPRNFAEGIFRGGAEPDQLYRRIADGIAGTPMPAAPVIEGQFERQDIWHLINFIRSLNTAGESTDAEATSGEAGSENAGEEKPELTDAARLTPGDRSPSTARS